MDREYIKAYAEKHYGSIRSESIYGLRRLLIDLPLERYGLDTDSTRYWLLTAQIEMARDELNKRERPKKRREEKSPWNLV